MTSARNRLFRLEPSLVRTLIRQRHAGTYVLYRRGKPVYVGRSDYDLATRLTTHARCGRAHYFGFNLHPDADRAYDMECALFHSLRAITSNRVHPASPKGWRRRCFICAANEKGGLSFEFLQRSRLRAPNTDETR